MLIISDSGCMDHSGGCGTDFRENRRNQLYSIHYYYWGILPCSSNQNNLVTKVPSWEHLKNRKGEKEEEAEPEMESGRYEEDVWRNSSFLCTTSGNQEGNREVFVESTSRHNHARVVVVDNAGVRVSRRAKKIGMRYGNDGVL